MTKYILLTNAKLEKYVFDDFKEAIMVAINVPQGYSVYMNTIEEKTNE